MAVDSSNISQKAAGRVHGWEEVENCVKKYMLFYFFKDTSSSLFPDISIRIKNCIWGTFLAVKWLRVCTLNAGAWL